MHHVMDANMKLLLDNSSEQDKIEINLMHQGVKRSMAIVPQMTGSYNSPSSAE